MCVKAGMFNLLRTKCKSRFWLKLRWNSYWYERIISCFVFLWSLSQLILKWQKDFSEISLSVFFQTCSFAPVLIQLLYEKRLKERRVAFLIEEDGKVKSYPVEASWDGGNHVRTSGFHHKRSIKYIRKSLCSCPSSTTIYAASVRFCWIFSTLLTYILFWQIPMILVSY